MKYQFREINGLLINEEFVSVFEENGLLSFEAIMAFSGGETFRRNRIRSVVKIELPEKGGKKHVLHLKRHTLNLKERIKGLFSLGQCEDGSNEWRRILDLNECSIDTFKPVAFGKLGQMGFPWKSFTITEHLYDCERLEDFIPKNFAGSSVDFGLKLFLTRKLAEIAGKFHGLGFSHNDFYLGHFFIQPESKQIYLIDLQRVSKSGKISNHDRIKDISQLYFSSTQIEGVSLKDRLRFLQCYLRLRKLDGSGRGLMKKIEAKNTRISRHTVKLLSKGNPAGTDC